MEASVAAPPAQGAPAPATQPPASGQGQGVPGTTGPGGSDGFNWGLFPNIPEAHRELLQPHLKDVQGHITKLEQQYAPYKDVMSAVQPDQVQDLLGFLNNYSQNPLQTWLGLAQSLKDGGHITNPEFDMDALVSYMTQQVMQEPDPEMPPWAQQMAQQLQQMSQAEEQRQMMAQQQTATQEQQQQQQMLAEARTAVRSQMTAAGIPTDLYSDGDLTGLFISYNGDVDQVVQRIIAQRDGLLGNFTQQNGGGRQPPTINGGVPQAPKNSSLTPKRGDGFRSASMGAEQMLLQANAANGQQ